MFREKTIIMWPKTVLLFVVFFSFAASAEIDKAHFFEVFGSSSSSKITAERVKLEKMKQTDEVKAYLGAILMKEAKFKSSAMSKLSQFTKGRKLLEIQIANNSSSVEFRVLRLMIQENCPSILGYSDNISKDAEYITKKFSSLEKSIQTVVLSYAKKSDALSASKLNSN